MFSYFQSTTICWIPIKISTFNFWGKIFLSGPLRQIQLTIILDCQYGSILSLAWIRAGRTAMTRLWVTEQNQNECIADFINSRL